MDLLSYIILIIFALFILIGGYYLVTTVMGPKKIEEVERLMEMGRTRDAISLLDKILEHDDRNMKARYLLARCHQMEGNHQMGALEFRQCIKIGKYSPETPEIHIRRALANSLLELGNKNDAKNEFLILTTLQPENYENFYQVGKLFHNAGIYAKAINFLSRATNLNGNHAESQALLGQSQYNLGLYQEARNTLLRTVQLKGDHRVARYYLGLALRMTGDLEWALKELEKAERDESVRDKAILARGMVYIDQEAYPHAITALQKGIKYAQPSSETAVSMKYLLAIAAEKNRDIHLALENWEEVEKMKPNYRDVREKIKQYSDFRTDDSIKDLMIANASQFEEIARKVIEGMGFQILSLNLISDSKIQSLAAEEDTNKMMVRNRYTLFLLQRDTDSLSEKHVRDFQEKMRESNAGKGIIMTTGDISPGALNYASTRPLDLYDSTRMVDILRSATGHD